MAAPAIALRFRDTTPGVDTIAAHREVLSTFGTVWWGWWKKEFETIDVANVRSKLVTDTDGTVLLVNRETRQAFTAKFVNFTDASGIDLERVPQYCRKELVNVAGLLLLTSIVDAEYDPELGQRLGERTLLWTRKQDTDSQFRHEANDTNAYGRSCIVHLSDLHFGSDYGFRLQREELPLGDARMTFTESLVADLTRLGVKDDIAAIVVSGDFMSNGDWNDNARRAALNEFEKLRAELGLRKDQIVPVPGNHDIVRYRDDQNVNVMEIVVRNQTNYQHEREFRTFVEELIDRSWQDTLNYVRRINLSTADLLICVVNSCTITATKWTEYGYVGQNGLDALRQLGREQIVRPTFKFLVLHHHLLPVARVEAPQSKGVTLALDASEILSESQRSGVQVVLHGHQHKPKISVYQDVPLSGEPSGCPIHVIANGSAGAKNDRLPHGERNSYCLFRLNHDHAELWMRELRLDGQQGAPLFHGKLSSPTNFAPDAPLTGQ